MTDQATALECVHGSKVRILLEGSSWEVALCRASSTSPECYPEFRDMTRRGIASPFVLGEHYGGTNIQSPGEMVFDLTVSDLKQTAQSHMEQMKANGWTENQLCPECGKEPGSCDWCHECDIELVCAQSDWGLEQATKITRDGVAYLILARPGSGKAWQTC